MHIFPGAGHETNHPNFFLCNTFHTLYFPGLGLLWKTKESLNNQYIHIKETPPMSETLNRLAEEKSLYLQQHKNNPVDWYPYGPEAIQKAKDENKPIFLSIGYSSCHWCHVMAKESFSDIETANFLNENFISIKVDREEYPDIDQYYQQACQLFIKTGGWPLSAFLFPDMRPFFVGTYYPNVKRGESATFLELLNELHRAYNEDKEQVETNATNVTKALENGHGPSEPVEFQGDFPPPMAIMDAIKEYADQDNKGYGHAPKFPHFAFYEWCVEQMLEGMITKEFGQHIVDTIERMLLGGMSDHARGGIHRYSTDDQFMVPHFEKMLYDQAGLLKLLSKFGLVYPSPIVFDTLMNTLEYLQTEMMHEDGYFFSAQDADSEGQEGLFFTFSEEEFEEVVNKASNEEDDLTGEIETLKKWFQITKEGNFTGGLNVISLSSGFKKELYTQENWEKVRRVRAQILQERKGRIPPSTDNKGICSWNSMLLSALVDVIQYCQVDAIKNKAGQIFNKALEGHYNNFLISKNNEGMILKHSTTNEAGLPYLEDFVSFSEAMLRVYEITGNPTFKQNFSDTMNFIFKEFYDQEKNVLLTRPIALNEHELYPNQPMGPYDSSFKSLPMTLIQLIKRGRVLLQDLDFGADLKNYIEESKNFILKNPISGGEGLRSLTYPENAFRVIKVPQKWLKDEQFVGFMGYFLPRFVLDCTAQDDDQWQICNLEQCELQGTGVKSFIETLTPKAPAQSEATDTQKDDK